MSFIYLASPYTGSTLPNEEAFDLVCKEAGRLMKEDKTIFCPIAMGTPIANRCDLPHTHEFWIKKDIEILRKAEELYVYKLPGWEDSLGVTLEIKAAEAVGIPITYLDYTP